MLGLTDDQIWEIIATEVVAAVRRSMPEMFGSTKTTMIEMFDDRYTALTEAATITSTATIAVVGIQMERAFQYRDFEHTTPLKFDGSGIRLLR